MNTKLEAAARQALEALEKTHYRIIDAGLLDQQLLNKNFTAATNLSEALAKRQAAEPVGEVVVPPFLTANEDAYIAKVLVPLNLVGAVTVGAKVYTQQPAQRPDEALLTFYQATDYPSLVAAMEGHIKKLQSKLQANPHTAIDAWNSREAMRAEQHPAPTQQPLTEEQKAVLRECRNQAMKWAAQAGIPECAAFGGVAQDLDWLCGQLGIAGSAAPTRQPLTDEQTDLASKAVDQIMEQAQVFASAWSLVGGRFDAGDGMENADAEKAELRTMVVSLARQAAHSITGNKKGGAA